jgi:hypothetical protein
MHQWPVLSSVERAEAHEQQSGHARLGICLSCISKLCRDAGNAPRYRLARELGRREHADARRRDCYRSARTCIDDRVLAARRQLRLQRRL